MESEKIDRINAFLVRHKYVFEALPQHTANQFLLIDDAIQARRALLASARESIKKKSINVQNIAADTKIARKTFYNNSLLRLYVEDCAAETFDERIEHREEIKKLQKQLAESWEVIAKYRDRDVDMENMRRTLLDTQKELANALAVQEEFKQRYESLLAAKEHRIITPKGKLLIPKDGKLGRPFETN